MSLILMVLGAILVGFFVLPFIGAIIGLLFWVAVIAGVIYACAVGGPQVAIPVGIVAFILFINYQNKQSSRNSTIDAFTREQMPELDANLSKLNLLLRDVREAQEKLGQALKLLDRDPDSDKDYRAYDNLISNIKNKVIPGLERQREDAYVAYVKKSLTDDNIYRNKIREVQSASSRETQEVINIYNSIRAKISKSSFFS